MGRNRRCGVGLAALLFSFTAIGAGEPSRVDAPPVATTRPVAPASTAPAANADSASAPTTRPKTAPSVKAAPPRVVPRPARDPSRRPVTRPADVPAAEARSSEPTTAPTPKVAGPVRFKSFFTTDDGRTWFADDVTHLSPFEHEGKLAYRCQVYRCGAKPPYVNYLEMYPPEVRKELEQISQENPADLPAAFARLARRIMVRRPGATEWITLTAENAVRYADTIDPRRPDCGDRLPELVRPQ